MGCFCNLNLSCTPVSIRFNFLSALIIFYLIKYILDERMCEFLSVVYLKISLIQQNSGSVYFAMEIEYVQ